MKIIVGIVAGGAGFMLGWLLCAFLTAGKTEDAYAEGYDQACKDAKKGEK
jgi:hypothetical protein